MLYIDLIFALQQTNNILRRSNKTNGIKYTKNNFWRNEDLRKIQRNMNNIEAATMIQK
jgi:hypothetical protein